MNQSYPGSLYGTREDRKAAPLISGLLWYFPDALAAVAHVSVIGNDQHNPGEPLHDARGKSNDDLDCAGRHLVHAGTLDTDGVRHTAKVAWRALRALQKELEEAHGLPLPRNARLPIEDVWMGGKVPVESSYVGIGFGAETYIPDPNLPAHILRRVERPLPYADWHSACGAASSEEEITEAIEGIVAEADDGWIEWAPPAETPQVPPLNPETIVEFKMRDGGATAEHPAGGLRWTHEDVGNDIVAYRVKQSDETPHSFLTRYQPEVDEVWIAWVHGSKVPRSMVDIKFQDGAVVRGINPAGVNWWSNDLVAYRYSDGADNGNAVSGS